MPNYTELFGYIEENAKRKIPMVTADSRTGTVVICGAGPSLQKYQGAPVRAREIWATNSALNYLVEHDLRVTHGFAIDMGEAMVQEWESKPDVRYLVSSSVHPDLLDHLSDRRVSMFHSFLGCPDPEGETHYERQLYERLYPTSVMVGHGLNAVPRAVCLALSMGFTDIRVYGADCGASGGSEMPGQGEEGYTEWLDQITLYADGRKASVYGENASMCEAVIDGVRWHSRPDMIISAVHLLELQRYFRDRIRYFGDTLVNALADKDQAFMSRLPALTKSGEVTHFRTIRE